MRICLSITATAFFAFSLSVILPCSLQGEEETKASAGETFVSEIEIETSLPRGVTSTASETHYSKVSGIVIERGTKRPIGRTSVYFVTGNTSVEARTDKEGTFSAHLPPGEYLVTIAAVGYERFETKITVNENEYLELTFRIEPTVISPYRVIVREKRTSGEVSAQRITIQEAMAVPGTNRDVMRVITNLPGVNSISVFNGFGSGLIIRGSPPEDSIYRVNDQWVPFLYHFGGLEAIIDPELVSSVDYYAGGYAPEFVSGLGGVVKLNLRDPRTDRWGGYGNLSLFSTSAMVEGPIGENDSIAVSLKRGFIDLYIMLAQKMGIFEAADFVTYPFYYDWSAQWVHRFSKNNTFKVMHIGAIDGTRLTTKDDDVSARFSNSFNLDLSFYQLFAEWSYKEERFSSLFTPMLIRSSLDAGMGPRANISIVNYQAVLYEKISWRLDDTNTILGGVRLGTGFYDMTANFFAAPKEGEVTYNPFGVEITDDKLRGYVTPTLWLMQNITVGSWIFSPGIAALWDTNNGHLFVDPRLMARYAITDRWTLKGAIGVYSKMPEGDETHEKFGTPGLRPEHSAHLIAGAEWRITDTIDFDIQGYYKRFWDLIVRTDPNDPRVYANKGIGYATGADVLLRHKMTDNFFGWLSYSFAVSRRKDAIGPGGEPAMWRPFDMDINHNLTLVASYKFNKYWQLGGRFNLQSGVPYTDLLGVSTLYDTDNDIYLPQYRGPINSDRMPVRHQLDLRLDKYWLFDTWVLSTYLDVQNVYYQKNVVGWAYNKDYTQRKEISLLPIMVFLGLKGDL